MLLAGNIGYSQEYAIRGHISDIETHESLAFVSITYNNGQSGVISNLDGNFEIKTQSHPPRLNINFVGYEPFSIAILPDSTIIHLNIKLKRKNIELSEVIIKPGKNPALRIMNKVVENRDKNNPEKVQSFTYTSYNKMYFTIQEDTLQNGNPQLKNDSLTRDSTEIKLKKFVSKQHLFLSEFVSERHYKYPDKNIENVISSKISGLNDPVFVLLSTQMQSFSFYSEYINILDQHFLNPINQGTASRYFYLLEDTIFSYLPDTVYVISFKPHKGKNFEGLSGIFYINTNGYAVQNVIAEPTTPDNRFSVKIQQQYDFIDKKQWFPTEINTNILFKNTKLKTRSHEHYIAGIGKSYLSNIKLNPDVSDMKFSNIELEVSPDANKQNAAYWDQHRTVPLTRKDSTTYHIIDSIGKKIKLDQKMQFLEAMVYGYFPIGGFNIDYRRLVGLNKFEGLKLGLGIATNPKIFSFASIGGFFTYGFRDKNWKYGGFVQLFPRWYSDTKLTVRYAKNVSETGGFSFLDDYVLNTTEFLRNYFITKMDKTRETELAFTSRTLLYLKYNIYINKSEKLFNNYQFTSPSLASGITDKLTFTEIGLQLKFAYGEKFMKTPRGQLVSLGTKYPVLWVNIRKGTEFFGGEINYTKYEAKLSKTFTTKIFGKTQMQLKTGKVFGDIPISNLYGSQGCYENFSIDVENNFATIRPGEFYSQEFASLFFKQNFGSLLYKGKNFRPELNLVTNIGWGKLSNEWMHLNITYKTMEKGYMESGILINRLLNMDFVSFGVGCYYRYGYYRFIKTADNFAFKLSFTYSL
jgi:hypothetical protein